MRFSGSLDSEWIQFEWLDEMGSKFWFQNTCETLPEAQRTQGIASKT